MKELYKNKDWLYQKYIIEELSMVKIGKLCGYEKGNPGSIYRYLKKYKIATRDYHECQVGKKSYWYGKKQSRQSCEKKSKALKNKTYEEIHGKEKAKELRELRRQAFLGDQNPMRRIPGLAEQIGKKNKEEGKLKEVWQQPEYIQRQEEIKKDPKWIENHRKTTEELWQDPEYIAKQRASRNIKPNKAEKKLDKFLQRILPDEYKYVGDFSFMIETKNPDFININGKKKIIELFGDYWHKGDDGKKRAAIFKKYGYDTLIIWEHELKDENLKNKIIEFNGVH